MKTARVDLPRTVVARARPYYYKLFRLRGADGSVTTISWDYVQYANACHKFRIQQAEFSAAVREAGKALVEGDTLTAAKSFSRQVRDATKALLEAKRIEAFSRG